MVIMVVVAEQLTRLGLMWCNYGAAALLGRWAVGLLRAVAVAV